MYAHPIIHLEVYKHTYKFSQELGAFSWYI